MNFMCDTVDFSSADNCFSFYSAKMAVTKYQVTSGALAKNPDNDSPTWKMENKFRNLSSEFKMLWDRFRKFDSDYVLIAFAVVSMSSSANTRMVLFQLYKEDNLREFISIAPSMQPSPEQLFVDADLIYNIKQKIYYSVLLQTLMLQLI